MKITYEKWKTLLNERLEYFNQTTRVIEYNKQEIRLNDGTKLTGTEYKKFKKRLMNTKTTLWIENIDAILSGKITVKQIKSKLCSIGGKSCQKLHKETIKKNLNSGIPWNKGKRGRQIGWARGLTKDTDARVKKLAKFGKKNGMFGKKHNEETKKLLSEKMKKKILEGTFTPNSNNRNTHWEAMLDNMRYRSSWEAWYNYLNPGAEYETLRISYEYNGSNKVYIVDFVDHEQKLVIEVKPKELTNNPLFAAKWNALCQWAKNNGYLPLLVDQMWLVSNTTSIDYFRFDKGTGDKIRNIYEVNKKN